MFVTFQIKRCIVFASIIFLCFSSEGCYQSVKNRDGKIYCNEAWKCKDAECEKRKEKMERDEMNRSVIKYYCVDNKTHNVLSDYIARKDNGVALIIDEWGTDVNCPSDYPKIVIFSSASGSTMYDIYNDKEPKKQSFIIDDEDPGQLRIDNINQAAIDSLKTTNGFDAGNQGIIIRINNGQLTRLGGFRNLRTPPKLIAEKLDAWRIRIERDSKYRVFPYVDFTKNLENKVKTKCISR